MPRPQTQSFEEMFGVGSVPIASYFGLPQGASADTRFSPQARGMLAQGEEYAREQAAMDAERAAEELLGGAANMTDADIQQQLLRSPKMFGTQAIQPLSGYMQYRQSTSPQTDETLGPVLREQIKDPYHRERFQQRMLDEGLSATDAFDAYRTDEYNMKFETALAEAGVPETEYAKLKTPSGKFIPSAVARAQAASKAAAKLVGTGKKVEPLDEEVEFLKDAIEQRKKIFEATGRADKLAVDPLMLDYISRYEKAANEKLTALRPPPQIKVSELPATQAVAEVAPAQAFRTPEERQKAVQEAEAAAPIKQAIDSAWTQQKAKLAEQIRKVYGDNPEDIVLAAQAVLSGEADPEDTSVGDEQLAGAPKPSYLQYLLRRIGRKPDEVVFAEPDNKRWGTQDVKNDELLNAWARDVLALASQLQQAPQKPAGGIKSMTQIE